VSLSDSLAAPPAVGGRELPPAVAAREVQPAVGGRAVLPAGPEPAARAARRPAGAVVAAAGPPLADAVALAAVAAVAGLAGWAATAGDGGGAGGAGWLLAGYLTAVFAALSTAGLHRLRITAGLGDQAGRMMAAALLPGIALLPWAAAAPVLRLVAGTAAALLAVRAAGAAGLRAARRRGRLTERALLVGTGPAGRQLARLLAEHPELGLRVQGLVAGPAGLAARVAREGISRVIVTAGDDGPGDTAALAAALRQAREQGADICVAPRLAGLGAAVPRGCLDEVWGVPLIPVRRSGARTPARAAKRALDLALAAVLLAVTAPVLALAALAVRLRLRRPALFRQARLVGQGRCAEIAKLRTLPAHGDPDTCWTVPAGHCGRLGRLLRITHLDELPQLAGVLRGDLSLVGPRPERPHFARQFAAGVPGYAGRFRMPAGMTGWAQVHGLNGDTSISDRARFDNYYIEYWSFWLDLLVLARTVTSITADAARWAASGHRAQPGGR
jgi:lipopolysaccharide/colanic/teichoic acid biosynthesis glycosyltransferase